MTQPKRIPDPEQVERTVERLRESNRQLELVTFALDELIALSRYRSSLPAQDSSSGFTAVKLTIPPFHALQHVRTYTNRDTATLMP